MDYNNIVKGMLDELLNKVKTKINEEADNLKISLTDYLYKDKELLEEKIKTQILQKVNDIEKEKNQIELLSRNKVVLDVGGIIYSTSLQTLIKYKDSKLAKLFSGHYNFEYDKEGKIFIDRNGKYFEYVLDSLRNEELILPIDETAKNGVLKEISFFELNKYLIKEPEQIPFKFDEKLKHPSITLSSNNLTVGKVGNQSHNSVLGNIEMYEGVYQWEFFTDAGGYWIGLGIADLSEITKDFTNDYSNSFMISSVKQMYRMAGSLVDIGSSVILKCSLNFDSDEFTITGPNSISLKNNTSFKGKKLRLIVNLFTSANVVSVRNFIRIK